MSFGKNSIKKGIEEKPRKVLIYGPPKMGKSTLAASVKDTLIIQTEDRMSHIDCDKTPVIECMVRRTLADGSTDPDDKRVALYDIFDFLMAEKHSYKQVVIDTIDWLEPLLHQYICEKNGWNSLVEDKEKEVNFGKGLKYHAVSGWRKLLDNLDYLRNEKGISIILVSHSMSLKIDPPDSDSYDREVMKVDKNAISVIEEWADVIGFYQRKIFVSKEEGSKTGKALPSKKRILHLGGDNPAFISGNSFNFPDEKEVNLSEAGKTMWYILTGKGE